MLFLTLFSLVTCKNDKCILDFDGVLIDLSELNIANNNYHYTSAEWGEYAFRLCGDLDKSDSKVPACGVNVTGWAGAGIHSGKCYPTAATDSQIVTKLSATQFHVEYGADTDSEPGSVDEVHTIHEFDCVDTQVSGDPVSVSISDEGKNRYITLKYKINCIQLSNTPTPTPTPVCDPIFTKASTTKPGLGIQFDLREFKTLQHGPVIIDDGNYELHFAPGSYKQCPLPYNCRHITPASIYVCRAGDLVRKSANQSLKSLQEQLGFCTSFGVASHALKFDQDGIQESDGVYARYNSNDLGKSANVYFKCNEKGDLHELTLASKMKGEGNVLNFTVTTPDVCIRTVTPVPDPAHRYCIHSSSFQNKNISFDLRDYNLATGYSGTVKLSDTSTSTTANAEFIIQPCGVLGCPTGYSCGSEVESSFWKCTDKTCVSVGDITTGDLHLDRSDANSISAKFGSSLYGTKTASILYTCSESHSEMTIESNATVDANGIYSVRVKGQMFCPKIKKGISAGAIFLIILASVIFLYILFGTLIMSLLRAHLTFPNQNFWIQFGLCVKEAVMFIFTCGKGADMTMKSTYDKV
ncbi:hypothetical protein TRFO_24599 [Tritrichomonas foetus]|uniref:MRH domain-containing protein n=1 Tax=Tritrichomonas foetus TaxID=1144522 RepID=A0A1J4K713_9EUKA|nr:hypothetical protein TRFO_24599 [Tritrichomonas foetus]|eukprot:OHT07265.1 hypothetical protein TRFO_24599 [Tritrichomonas foetus]